MYRIYFWIGFDKQGRERRGYAQVATRGVVVQRLARSGIGAVRVRTAWRTWWQAPFWVSLLGQSVRATLTMVSVGMVCQHMAALLRAGVPVHQVVAILARTATHPIVSGALHRVHRRVMQGQALSDAFCAADGWPVLLGMVVCAGQQADQVAAVVDDLAIALLTRDRYRQQLLQALLVPLATLGVGLMVMVGVIMIVVPMVVGLYPVDQVPIGVATLARLSNGGWWQLLCWLIGGVSVLGVCWYLAGVYDGVRRWRDALIYKVPLVGRLWRLAHGLATLKTLGVLLRAQVPLCTALTLCVPLNRNQAWRVCWKQCVAQLSQGAAMNTAVRSLRPGVVPVLIQRIFVLAQSESDLAALCHHAATVMAQRFAYGVRTRLALLAPGLMVMIGSAVLVVLYVLLNPLLEKIGTLGG